MGHVTVVGDTMGGGERTRDAGGDRDTLLSEARDLVDRTTFN